MSQWPTRPLGEIVSEGGGFIRTGPFGSQLHKSDYVDDPNGIPVVMPTDMTQGRIDRSKIARIDQATADRLSQHLLAEGDIALSRRGDVGRSAWIGPDDLPAFCGTGSMRVHPGMPISVRSDYLRWFFRCRLATDYLEGHAVGATMPNLNAGVVTRMPVPILPVKLQALANEVLSSIDDMIENNRRRVEVLEEMARAIYREWFVHFRYPGHEHVQLIDSPLGPIPDGWWVGCVNDLVTISKTTVDPSTADPSTPAVGLEHIPRRQITLDDWGRAGDIGSRKATFVAGDVLFGKIRPYFHKVSVAPVDGICSTDAIVLRPHAEHWGQAALVISSDEFVAHAVQTSNGTKMPRADWKVIRDFPVAIPPIVLARRFSKSASTLLMHAQALMFQARCLVTLRDLLLPKLVTGQIDVSHLDLDSLTEAVVA